jgi:nitrate reductase gamma subunit
MSAFLADAVLIVHLAFVVFVVAGGLFALKWPWVAWLHVPSAAWGAAVEFGGWICPLTPLEDRFRELAGQTPHTGDFVARYLLPVLYPEGLTRDVQIGLGAAVVLLNVAVYALVLRRRTYQECSVPSSRRATGR